MTATWLARFGVVAAVGILSAVVIHAAPPPRPTIGGRLFTVGTVGSGTANSVDVPDLGTVAANCSVTGDATATLTNGPAFDWFVATSSTSLVGMLNQTSWTSDKVSETLWLKNVQGQWRLEYFAHPSVATPSICQVAVEVTRIS
jgi:hypothetical protein